jgi:hypothetical protein
MISVIEALLFRISDGKWVICGSLEENSTGSRKRSESVVVAPLDGQHSEMAKL